MSAPAGWQKLQEHLRSVGAVAAVAVSPESVRHLSGVHFASQVMIRRRLAFVIVPAEGTPVLLVQQVLERTARTLTHLPEVAIYVVGSVAGLARTLQAKGLDRGRLLLELDFLPVADLWQLQSLLPESKAEDAGDLFHQIRLVRTPAEQVLLRRHTRAAERAMQVAFHLAGGATEQQVYGRMHDALLALGGDTIPFLTLASGAERTLLTHAQPTDRVIREGDLLRVDMVGFFSGMYTDMARTAVVGRATREQRELYRKVRGTQLDVIEHLRPGLTAEQVYGFFRERATARGLSYAYRYVGHSTGYQVVEEPVLTVENAGRLEAGMVLCVEVMDKVEGLGCIHLEDMMLLRDDGPEIWTEIMASDELPEIE